MRCSFARLVAPDALARDIELLALDCVRRRARVSGLPATDDAYVLALRGVLSDALGALGDGPFGQAARLLFGATDGVRGRAVADRRRLAAC